MQIEQQLRQFLVENFLFGRDADLTSGTSLLEHGIVDSTGMLELVAFLEETFAITVADHELIPENLDSIANLVAFVERKQAEGLAIAG
jgi:acyl carrier protein